jgi:hypothetical protein
MQNIGSHILSLTELSMIRANPRLEWREIVRELTNLENERERNGAVDCDSQHDAFK